MIAPFELTGKYGDFIFNEVGKRRMILRQGAREWLLKVRRSFRRRIVGKFSVGDVMSVAVVEEHNAATGSRRYVVTQVLPWAASVVGPASPPEATARAAACVIRVCTKKNCWRNGGSELFKALEREIHNGGHAKNIELRQVGCLDRCKQAPNADCGGRTFTRCSPSDAAAVIAQATGGSAHRQTESR